ncbi:MAG TPA: hypothetical protein VMM13_07255, partial [Euzebya sp.]|nr:hypothetical protein [Euzebya sp.]
IAIFLTRVHNRLIRTGLAELRSSPPLRRALEWLNTEIDRSAAAHAWQRDASETPAAPTRSKQT